VKYSYQLDKEEFCQILKTVDSFVEKLATIGQTLISLEASREARRASEAETELAKAKTESLNAEGRSFRAKYDMASARLEVEAAKARKLAACRTEEQLAAAKAEIDAEGPNPFEDPDIES